MAEGVRVIEETHHVPLRLLDYRNHHLARADKASPSIDLALQAQLNAPCSLRRIKDALLILILSHVVIYVIVGAALEAGGLRCIRSRLGRIGSSSL
jgi:hypothetical protein